ncbi:Hypothetical predicted protein [Pelobates cultripes]|uniref:Uncharacterized protein n=1 Tax=Pelobates cultripes TaxID=61616 RepID=A0AAD1TLL6_PELCU|nr:Hypothetical predicted protein [Pelobates cultripes]
MQSGKEFDICNPATSATITPTPPAGLKLPILAEASLEQMNSEELHSLLDAAMAKSVTQAIYTAMGAMSDNITQSIPSALWPTQLPPTLTTTPPESIPVAPSGHKAAKKSRHLDEDASKIIQTDRVQPVTEPVVAPQLRAPHRAKSELEEGKSLD